MGVVLEMLLCDLQVICKNCPWVERLVLVAHMNPLECAELTSTHMLLTNPCIIPCFSPPIAFLFIDGHVGSSEDAIWQNSLELAFLLIPDDYDDTFLLLTLNE